MLIRSREIDQLAWEVRQIIDGANLDLRDNKEGSLSVLRDDINSLVRMKSDQVSVLKEDYGTFKDVLTDISHQLKTPLTSALLRVDLLEDSLHESVAEEKQEEFIRDIQINLRRTEWLITAMLNMAKMETGVIEFQPQDVPSDELVERALLTLKPQLELKELEMIFDGESTIFCDKRWTAEAVMNIVGNAVEHAPYGSEVHVGAGENPLCSWISVRDQGIGFTKAQMIAAFQKFEGSEDSIGHGIGLPFAQKIMRMQNGDIEVKNRRSDQGAIVTLKFYKS